MTDVDESGAASTPMSCWGRGKGYSQQRPLYCLVEG